MIADVLIETWNRAFLNKEPNWYNVALNTYITGLGVIGIRLKWWAGRESEWRWPWLISRNFYTARLRRLTSVSFTPRLHSFIHVRKCSDSVLLKARQIFRYGSERTVRVHGRRILLGDTQAARRSCCGWSRWIVMKSGFHLDTFLGTFAKLRKATINFVSPSAWNNSSPTGRFSWNLIFEYFANICWKKNSSFIKIGQENWAL